MTKAKIRTEMRAAAINCDEVILELNDDRIEEWGQFFDVIIEASKVAVLAVYR